MYATVRELTIKPQFKDENKRRVHDELLPQFREIPGFLECYLIYGKEDTEISIGLFKDKKGADEMNRLANAFVKTISPNVHLTAMTEGEVVVESRTPVPA